MTSRGRMVAKVAATVVAVVASACIGAYIGYWLAEQTPEWVTARHIGVVDAEGKLRVILDADDKGVASILITGADGHVRVVVRVDGDGAASVVLADAERNAVWRAP